MGAYNKRTKLNKKEVWNFGKGRDLADEGLMFGLVEIGVESGEDVIFILLHQLLDGMHLLQPPLGRASAPLPMRCSQSRHQPGSVQRRLLVGSHQPLPLSPPSANFTCEPYLQRTLPLLTSIHPASHMTPNCKNLFLS